MQKTVYFVGNVDANCQKKRNNKMRMSAQIAEACYMKETDSAEAAAQKYQNQSRKYSQRNQHQNTVKIVENF